MGYLGRNGAVTRGRILFEGRDLVGLPDAELRRVRGSRIAVVYQEPSAALNPSLTIGRQLMEVPLLRAGTTVADARAQVVRVMGDVHLPDPESVMRRYPHQVSGGQKQRVVLGMALLANPALLLLDEPTTGLDVTVAATVLDLVNELREKYRTALVYVSHNLGVIAQVCDQIGVMYAGEMVESAPAAQLFASPRHPYTRGLIASLPALGADKHCRAADSDPRLRPQPDGGSPGLRVRATLRRSAGGAVRQWCDREPARRTGPPGALRALRRTAQPRRRAMRSWRTCNRTARWCWRRTNSAGCSRSAGCAWSPMTR